MFPAALEHEWVTDERLLTLFPIVPGAPFIEKAVSHSAASGFVLWTRQHIRQLSTNHMHGFAKLFGKFPILFVAVAQRLSNSVYLSFPGVKPTETKRLREREGRGKEKTSSETESNEGAIKDG